MVVAGACHDHEHPGFNNVYLVDTKDVLAIRYNGNNLNYLIFLIDQSVLECHHVASSFALMLDPRLNIWARFSPADYKRAR